MTTTPGWLTKGAVLLSQAQAGDLIDLPTISGIRGVAWPYNSVDRMKRRMLPGAFGDAPFDTSLLAYHDDTKPIGLAHLWPDAAGLHYEATFTQGNAFADEIKGLIRDKAIAGVSIGWVPLEWWVDDDGIINFARVDVAELSVVPVPANKGVILQAASLASAARDLGVLEAVQRSHMAPATRSAIQAAHDATVTAGAACPGADSDSGGDGYAAVRPEALLSLDMAALEVEAIL